MIDIRDMWKDGEEQWEMAYGGFEKERGTLKYRCPAKHYDYKCGGERWCPVGKAVRISLEEDRRIFTPLARSSYRWKSIYKKRTAVERVNSRLDVSFGFEQHYIRGLKKMKLRCSLTLCIMLAMALGRVKEKQKGLMRSLVKVALSLNIEELQRKRGEVCPFSDEKGQIVAFLE